jgi:hypothetical protein
MAASINMPDALTKGFTDLIEKDGIDLDMVQDGSGLVSVIEGEKSARRESTLTELYTNGWINCELARQMADNLSIPYSAAGKIMNFLDIKVRNCGLGCF